MSDMTSLAQVVTSEPPAAPRHQAAPRRNGTNGDTRPRETADDTDVRRRDEATAATDTGRSDEGRHNRSDESSARDDEGSFRSHVQKAMERNQPKDKNTQTSKTALLQAALATAEQVSGQKSARQPLPLPGQVGQTDGDGSTPDGVHRAVLAALGKQANAQQNNQAAGQANGKAARTAASESLTQTGQTSKAGESAKDAASDQAAAKGKSTQGSPEGKSTVEAKANGEGKTAAETSGAKQDTVKDTASAGTPVAAEDSAAKTRAAGTQTDANRATDTTQRNPAANAQSLQPQTGQASTDGDAAGSDARGDGQGRFTLNQAAAATAGSEAERSANAAATNTGGQTFEATIESATQGSEATSVTTTTAPSIATAAPAATAQATPAEGAGEVSPADQVFAQMRANLRGAGDSITIRLDPPELGQVRISLEMDADGLRAQLRASNTQTLGDLQREAQTLINRLTEAGIQVRRIDVQPTEQTGDRAMHDNTDGQSQQGQATSQEAQDQSGDARSSDGEPGTAPGKTGPGEAHRDSDEQENTPEAPPAGDADGSINVMM
jgi:flagellar hook-length control protein FliK